MFSAPHLQILGPLPQPLSLESPLRNSSRLFRICPGSICLCFEVWPPDRNKAGDLRSPTGVCSVCPRPGASLLDQDRSELGGDMTPAEELGPMETLSLLVAFYELVLCVLQWILGTPYGRHGSPIFSMGPSLPAKLAWVVQELPSLLMPLYVVTCTPAPRLSHWPNRILLAIFVTHYLQRSLIFPFLIRGGKPIPVAVFLVALVFCALNGYLQGQYLSNYAVYSDNWIKDPRFITGCAIWLIGMLINIYSDNILRNLRKPGETGYKIPRGGLFEYVTAANYSGEVIEWCGYALASWSFEGFAFALFTTSVLSCRAKEHHRWYLEKFEDYPKLRKIIIPFLY